MTPYNKIIYGFILTAFIISTNPYCYSQNILDGKCFIDIGTKILAMEF